MKIQELKKIKSVHLDQWADEIQEGMVFVN